jgi:hypothetical protein
MASHWRMIVNVVKFNILQVHMLLSDLIFFVVVVSEVIYHFTGLWNLLVLLTTYFNYVSMSCIMNICTLWYDKFKDLWLSRAIFPPTLFSVSTKCSLPCVG